MSRSTHIDRLQYSRRRFLRTAIGVAPVAGLASSGAALLHAVSAYAQSASAAIERIDLGGLFVFRGAGCNVIAMPGDDGALMIDGGLRANADALLRAVFDATGDDRIRMLINTHWHPEQTGANETVGVAGGTIFAQEKTAMYLGSKVYATTSDGRLEPVEPLAEPARPSEVTRGDGALEFAGVRIDYGYLPAAHTDGDLYVHFPEMKVLAAGGVVAGDRWPLLDYRNGAWYGGRVRALEWLAELVDDDTRVVPADGPLLTGRDIVRQRDIYEELFDTLIGYMNKGFGPEDAAANTPLAQYDVEFGDASEFVYGAYRSMLIAYVPE
jgi:cyclase